MIRLTEAEARRLGLVVTNIRQAAKQRRVPKSRRTLSLLRPGTPGPWLVEFKGVQPPTLNALTRGKIRDRIRLGKSWRNQTLASCLAAGVSPATGKRRVTVIIYLGPRQKGPDPDAYSKAVGDSLFMIGALRDDTRNGVEWGTPEFEPGLGARGSALLIEEV